MMRVLKSTRKLIKKGNVEIAGDISTRLHKYGFTGPWGIFRVPIFAYGRF